MCLLLTFFLLALIVLLLVLVVVPQLGESITSLGGYVAAAAGRFVTWAEEQFAAYPEIHPPAALEAAFTIMHLSYRLRAVSSRNNL